MKPLADPTLRPQQRSQRFTIPTSPLSATQKPRSPHPVPSLPYQPPPPPVQTQTIASSDAFYSFNRNPPADDPEPFYSYSQQQPSSYHSSPASSYARTAGAGLRGGLPTEWMGRAGGGGGGFEYERQHHSGYAALVGRPGPDDEVCVSFRLGIGREQELIGVWECRIPTAIVIKNIPFQVPKETLLGIMVRPFFFFFALLD